MPISNATCVAFFGIFAHLGGKNQLFLKNLQKKLDTGYFWVYIGVENVDKSHRLYCPQKAKKEEQPFGPASAITSAVGMQRRSRV